MIALESGAAIGGVTGRQVSEFLLGCTGTAYPSGHFPYLEEPEAFWTAV